MSIAPALLKAYPALNEAQRAIVGHSAGPLLVIAGPGSGKTFSLVLRTMNLLLLGKAAARQLVLCTFTEKAAFELRDRVSATARKIGYTGDLSELKVSTIHGLCNRLLTIHRHRTPLGNDYETLDELTQLLFIFEHFEPIVGAQVNGRYFGRWSSRWGAIAALRSYFDKITEELVDPVRLLDAPNPFLQQLGAAYTAYQQALFNANRLDFAHQQKLVYDLLLDPVVASTVMRGVQYVMVDEYQDTNYIQEQLLLKLSADTHNLCVVGDEDQSLYRFRGATVRKFWNSRPGCRIAAWLNSPPTIAHTDVLWQPTTAGWPPPTGQIPAACRSGMTRLSSPTSQPTHPDYPAIFAIWGTEARDEATRFADLVVFLKQSGVIADYSQVALLLHSVRLEHSGPYLAALWRQRAFRPSARAPAPISTTTRCG